MKITEAALDEAPGQREVLSQGFQAMGPLTKHAKWRKWSGSEEGSEEDGDGGRGRLGPLPC